MTDRAFTSKNVMPRNSGVSNVRATASRSNSVCAVAPDGPEPCPSARKSSQRIDLNLEPQFELVKHVFDLSRSMSPAGRASECRRAWARPAARGSRARADSGPTVDLSAVGHQHDEAAERSPGRLVVRTVPVPDPGDLIARLPEPGALTWVRRGDGLVGWGTAAKIILPAGEDRF